jgi:hypothetical protein
MTITCYYSLDGEVQGMQVQGSGRLDLLPTARARSIPMAYKASKQRRHPSTAAEEAAANQLIEQVLP